MTKSIQYASIESRFDHLFTVLSSDNFLQMKGLGNEVPFFIAPHEPKERRAVDQMRGQLVRKLDQSGIEVLDINLYDLSREVLVDEGDWDYWMEKEPTVLKDVLKEELQGVLDSQSVLIPAIVRKMEQSPSQILFLSGVGEVFPYIRSHNVLNNLQKAVKLQPTLMFFPGGYTHSLQSGASLDLFGKLRDDKYYRAFNIYDREI